MNGASGIDPTLAVQEATQSDLVRRKLDMDALKKRLGDTATKQEKLRESCEGFEAIFLQKMWEQMRKTVPKEGYLHSKDEEMYQSLFDIELCKKMASAGGIGLADMLYTQLSQQLENTGRTTTPSTYRQPLDIAASEYLMAVPPERADAPLQAKPLNGKALTAEELYSPLPQEEPEEAAEPKDVVSSALEEIKVELGLKDPEAGGAVREWAAARDAAVAGKPQVIEASVATGSAQPAPAPVQGRDASSGASQVSPAQMSWQGPGPVSAKPKSMHLFGRDRAAAKAKAEETAAKPPVQPKGMAPQNTVWPLAAQDSAVVSRFGWEDDPASGKRRWNAGVRIAAEPETPVRAVLAGTVVYAGPREGHGHTVVLEHKDGFRSYYGNLTPGGAKVGDKIRHGAEFAKISAQVPSLENGEKTASLHFELKKGEMALNPESAINRPREANG